MKFNEEFLINYWCGIPEEYLHKEDGSIDEYRIVEMKEAGFNHIDAGFCPEDNLGVLDIAHKLGLKVTVHDNRIRRALSDKENRRQLLEDAINEYKDHPALFGYHVVDEPHPDMFDTLAEIRSIMSELDPVHEAYINLFPNYGFPVPVADIPYEKYVNDFMTKVKPEILSYDNYHWIDGNKLENQTLNEEEAANTAIAAAYVKKVDRPGFIDNLEVIREKGMEYDTPYMSIILVVEHGPYRYVSEGDIRYDAFHSLAYGCSRLCYFTYWTPGGAGRDEDSFWKWKEGMISKDGKKNEHYYMVQNINRELSVMGNVLIGKKSLGVFYNNTCPETLTKPFTGFGCVDKVEGDDVTLGFFEGNYLVIANRDTDNESNIELTSASCIEIFDALSNEWIAIESESNVYSISLEPGDAMIVRFINKINI